MAKKEIEHTSTTLGNQDMKGSQRMVSVVEPYELPEGWKWCRLGDVAKYINGRAFKPKEWEKEGKPIIRIQNLTNSSNSVNRSTKIFEDKYLITKNDLLYAWSASLGAYLWRGEDGWLNQHIFKVIPNDNVDKMYLYHGLVHITENLYAKAHGSGMVHVTLKPFLNTQIPLPPTLAEQQRIVNRIESMFAKLDEAKEKAQNVLDGFETRKAAILHKAFTGELTAKWRKENGVSLNISESTFKGICHKITDGFHNSPKPVSEGYPYIMAGDIKENGIDFNNGLFMDKKNHDELYNKAHPEKGDILVVNIGAGTGKSAIIDVDFEFSFKNCAILKLNKDIVNPMYVYLFFYLKKDYILKEITRGGAQPFLSLKMINELTISYPSLPEQVEIVRILDIIIEKENKAKQAAEAVLEQIDLLKKSILARAFRGEL